MSEVSDVSESRASPTTHLRASGLQPAPPQPQGLILPTGSARVWRIMFLIGKDTAKGVGVEVSSRLLIGRSDPSEGYTPDFDMTPFGGIDAGISRKHCLLIAAEDCLYIRDLKSTNGTHLNGFTLRPEQSYKLNDGDVLELGQAHMVVNINRLPA